MNTTTGGWLTTSRRVAWAWLRLPHLLPVVVVLLTTWACAVLVPGDPPGARTLIILLLAMLGGQLAIGAVNEIVDVDLDRVAKPYKPIPAGDVSVNAARGLTLGSLILMLFMSGLLGWASLLLCAFGTAIGLAYDFVFKRTIISWLPYLIALPLLPIWVWTALGQFDARLLWLYPLGAPAVLGVHLAQALPDIGEDRAAGLRHLAVRLGQGRAFTLSWAVMAMTASAILVVGAALDMVFTPLVIGVGVTATLALISIALTRGRERVGVVAAFPCIAIATAALAVSWILALRLG